MEVAASEKVVYLAPDLVLSLRLLPVARRVFDETFRDFYDAEPFDAFLERIYSIGGPMHRDLNDPLIQWRVAVFEGKPIGYAKLTPLRAPAPNAEDGSLELQQLYVLKEWHGAGIAQQLMNWAVESARRAGAAELYLTVFQHNERAKRFYARNGFEDVGKCIFQLGNRMDEDRVWRKRLDA